MMILSHPAGVYTAKLACSGVVMLEVEMKFAVADFADIEGRLAELGAQRTDALVETDHYFNAADRDFARTDEALRVRRVGSANYVTYKGPKLDAQTKTRTEIEVPLAQGDAVAEDFMRLLIHLGYRLVAVVRKRRRIYRIEHEDFPVEVCLDDVEEVGRYVELEIMAAEEKLDAARRQLSQLAEQLGLTASERRSYLELLLARRGGKQP
jgi:adenylate cyclase class 2